VYAIFDELGGWLCGAHSCGLGTILVARDGGMTQGPDVLVS